MSPTRKAPSVWDKTLPVRRYVRRHLDDIELPPRKEAAECCLAKRDDQGRLPVGFCSAKCIRRPSNWKRINAPRPQQEESA